MTHWTERHKVVPAVYMVLRRGNEVLLLKRANTDYMDGYYGLPAGHLDGGEPATAAAVREAEEEIGVVIDPADLKLAQTAHRQSEEGDHERIDLFFEVKKWHGEPRNAEPEKCSEIGWYPLKQLPENTIPLVHAVLENVARGEIYSEHGFEG